MPDVEVPTPQPSKPQKMSREQRYHLMVKQQMADLNQALTMAQIDLQLAQEQIGELQETVTGLEAVIATLQGSEPEPTNTDKESKS